MQLFKILIFGGSFNPVHYGHKKIFDYAANFVNPDLSIIIPKYLSPVKDDLSFIDSIHRINMLKQMFIENDKLSISSVEIDKKISFTIDTINELTKEYNNAEFYLLIGADQWNNLKEWKNYVELAQKVKFVIANRNDIELNKYDFCDSPLILKNELLPISSTEIRFNPKPYQTTFTIFEYINNNGLYAMQRIKSNNISQKRFEHSLRVAYYAMKLMKVYNPKKVSLAYSAGIYHDIAKEIDLDIQKDIAQNNLGLYDYKHPKLLHGYIGNYILRTKYCFCNDEILNAISRHTRPFDYYSDKPDLLTKILYISDKLEPNRTNEDIFGENIEYFRELALTDIDKCFSKLYKLLQENFTKLNKSK